MTRRWTALLATFAAITIASTAGATDYRFSYGITNGSASPLIYASGTITTGASCGTGCFYVDAVTGSNRGATITGYDFFADYGDQQFYPATGTMHVDGSGLTYQVGSTSYNIYATGGGYNEFRYDTATGDQIGSSAFASFFNVSPTASGVPEPSAWAMMIGGIAAAGAMLRRRRSQRPSMVPA